MSVELFQHILKSSTVVTNNLVNPNGQKCAFSKMLYSTCAVEHVEYVEHVEHVEH